MTSYYVLLYVWENGIMYRIRLPEPVVRNTQPSLYSSLEMWPEATAPIRPLPAIATVYQRTVNRHVIQRFHINKPSLFDIRPLMGPMHTKLFYTTLCMRHNCQCWRVIMLYYVFRLSPIAYNFVNRPTFKIRQKSNYHHSILIFTTTIEGVE